MEKVYECEMEKKKDLMLVLEENPYDADSFARKGYKIKEGSQVGLDEKKVYLYLSADEEFMKKAREKLKGICEESSKKNSEKVAGMIREEEEQATSGFGDIFG